MRPTISMTRMRRAAWFVALLTGVCLFTAAARGGGWGNPTPQPRKTMTRAFTAALTEAPPPVP